MKRHLEITDLPQDSLKVLYGVRKPLVNAFNKCRETPYKLTLLKETLKFCYNKCVEFEKQLDKERSEVVKALEAIAGEADERKTTENLKLDLAQAKARKASQIAGKSPESPKNNVSKANVKPEIKDVK